MKEFTVYYVRGTSGCVIAFVLEYPNIVTQGATVEKARAMVTDCIEIMLAEGASDFEHRTAEAPLLLSETLRIGKPDA